MTFFRSVMYYISVGAIAYAGMSLTIPNESLVGALIPMLFLFATVDVWHYLTLGTIDLGTALLAFTKRTPLAFPETWSATVSPWDVDDSGMMKEDRYVRHCGYAIRKLWLKNGLEKSFQGAGYDLVLVGRSLRVARPLGLFTTYKIRTVVLAARDDIDSIVVEQKILAGSGGVPAAVSYVRFQLQDKHPHLRKPGTARPPLSKLLAHAVTRKLAGGLRGGARPSSRQKAALAKNKDTVDAALKDVATLVSDGRVQLPEPAAFVATCAAADAATAGPPPPKKPPAAPPSPRGGGDGVLLSSEEEEGDDGIVADGVAAPAGSKKDN